MRISNTIGALFALLLAIGFDYALFVPITTWVQASLSGQAEALVMLGVVGIFLFITFGIPIMIATEDEQAISGE